MRRTFLEGGMGDTIGFMMRRYNNAHSAMMKCDTTSRRAALFFCFLSSLVALMSNAACGLFASLFSGLLMPSLTDQDKAACSLQSRFYSGYLVWCCTVKQVCKRRPLTKENHLPS